MRSNNNESVEIKPIKTKYKIVAIVLLLSEVGFIPFSKIAAMNSARIFFRMVAKQDLSNEADDAVGILTWVVSSVDALTTILSVGSVSDALREIIDTKAITDLPTQFQRHFAMLQATIFFSAFSLGSFAAPVGILSVYGRDTFSLSGAVFCYFGQIAILLLQTRQRCVISTKMIFKFFEPQSRAVVPWCEFIISRQFCLTTLASIFNLSYKALRFYYVGYLTGSYFNWNAKLFGFLTSGLATYVIATTQTLGNYLDVYENFSKNRIPASRTETNNLIERNKNNTEVHQSRIGLLFLVTSWILQTFCVIDFAYTFFYEKYQDRDFSQRSAILATSFLLASGFSSYQYVNYIFSQVNCGIFTIKKSLAELRLRQITACFSKIYSPQQNSTTAQPEFFESGATSASTSAALSINAVGEENKKINL